MIRELWAIRFRRWQLTPGRWGIRAGLVVTLIATFAVVGATGASAQEGNADQANFGLTDSRGNSIAVYSLSINSGSRLNPLDTALLIWSVLMNFAWAVYRGAVSVGIFLVRMVLQMDWVPWVMTPLQRVSDVSSTVIDKIGYGPLMMTILGCVVAVWWAKGRWGAGFGELVVGCLIAAVCAVFLADPMNVVAGDNGLIQRARDAGIDLATTLETDGSETDGSDSTEYIDGVTSSMVDALIRAPHQFANYGIILDGGDCEDVYDESLTSDSPREVVAECAEEAGEHAKAPDAFAAVSVLEILPTALAVLGFGLLLAVVMAVTVLAVGWSAIKLMWTGAAAVVPGGPRAAWFNALGSLATAWLTIAGASVFVIMWMEIIEAVFATGDQVLIPWRIRVELVNLLLVFGPIVMFIFRHKIAKSVNKASVRLSRVGPNGSAATAPSALPQGDRFRRRVEGETLQGIRRFAQSPGKDSDNRTQSPAPVVSSGPAKTNTGIPSGPGSVGAKAVAGREDANKPDSDPDDPPDGGETVDPPSSGPDGGSPAPAAATAPSARHGASLDDPGATRLRLRLSSVAGDAIEIGALVGSGGASSAASALVRAKQVGTMARTASDAVRGHEDENEVNLRRRLAAAAPQAASAVVAQSSGAGRLMGPG